MKKLNQVLSLVTVVAFSQVAIADTMTLPQGSVGLSQITSAEIVKVEDGCPPNARCIIASTNVTAKFTMGCTSVMSPVGYSVQHVSDSLRDMAFIMYTAYEVTNENAIRVRCAKPHTEIVRFNLPGLVLTADEVALFPQATGYKD